MSTRLEADIGRVLVSGGRIDASDAAALARVITAIIHISATTSVYLHRSDAEVLADIREQIQVALPRNRDTT